DVIHTSESADRLMGISEGATAEERLAKTEEFTRALEVNNVKLVRTIHEPVTSFASELEQKAAELLDAHTSLYIAVDGSAVKDLRGASVILPYANMSERFTGYPTRPMGEYRILGLATEPNDDTLLG